METNTKKPEFLTVEDIRREALVILRERRDLKDLIPAPKGEPGVLRIQRIAQYLGR